MADKQVEIKVATSVDDDEVKALEERLEEINSKSTLVNVDVEGDEEVDATKEKVDELDGTEIGVKLDTANAMAGIEQISQGFTRLKQGALEIKDAFGEILGSAGAQEMNKTFLEMNLGPEKAKSALQDINSIVNNLPGDDTALQGLLSQAAAKNAGITRQELEAMGIAATDYFSAMSFYGKSATEAQQDMTNYILSGNTAELALSPILQDHIDKLKEGTTIQERSQLLQEALNEAGWGGISTQDTYNNKLETFNGMLERGRYNLGGLFQEGAKSAMDFAMQLDDATHGWVGMGIALAGFASPLTDTIMGLGQMATGMRALKDLGFIQYLKDLEIMTKLSAAADYVLAGAQAVLNAVMALNPIILVAIALAVLVAALVWAYYNVDWFREMVDNAWASLQEFVGVIYSYIQPALQVLGALFDAFTQQLGLDTNDWIQAILGFILFIPQLPAQLTIALVNAIANLLGFKGNFVSTMLSTATNGVNNFINQIRSLPGKFRAELNSMTSYVNQWASTLPQKFWDAGVQACANFLNALGIHSPGYMQVALLGELEDTGKRIPKASQGMISNISRAGTDITNSFNPELGVTTGSNSLTGGVGGVTINLEIGSVDNEERINEIVDAVRRALAWDNKTAGRTV